MSLQNTKLQLDINILALRYEEKVGAILQSLHFFASAEKVAETHVGMKKVIDKFEFYLRPHSLDQEKFFSGLFLFSLVAEVEIFLVDVMKVIIHRYPKKVGAIEFKLSEILDSSTEELVTMAAENHLNRLMYKRPTEYLGELANMLSIDKDSIEKYWPAFVEAKARRDLGTHNNWLINDIYKKKIAEVDLKAPLADELSMCPNFAYLTKTIKNCDLVVRSIRDSLLAKYV